MLLEHLLVIGILLDVGKGKEEWGKREGFMTVGGCNTKEVTGMFLEHDISLLFNITSFKQILFCVQF